QRCRRMPQIVEMDAGQPRRCKERAAPVAQQIDGIERLTNLIGEDQVQVLPRCLEYSVLARSLAGLGAGVMRLPPSQERRVGGDCVRSLAQQRRILAACAGGWLVPAK